MQTDIAEMSTNLDNGLSAGEVRQRILKYGYNEVPEKKRNRLRLFARKFWGITPLMLGVTMALTWFLGKHLEFYLVLGLLIFNAALGFIQEERADAALEVLKQRLSVHARVRRGGQWLAVPARELVPGDVVRLRAGDFLPADVRVAEGTMEVDQSSLTGESLPIEKKENEVVLAGTTIRRGEATGLVASTGPRTYLGRTVDLVQSARPKLHMEEVTSKVVLSLLVMVCSLLAIGLALAAVKGMRVVRVIPLAAILLVSAIPVALPTLFAVSMAMGSSELAKKKVLVTRLSATEDAATMDTLCVDKTGTLTLNRLDIVDMIPATDFKKEDIILFGALASQEANQDPIDAAFLAAARDKHVLLEGYAQERFVPFDASTRRTEATIRRNGSETFVFKGALNSIVPLCPRGAADLAGIQAPLDSLSARGYRIMAVAVGNARSELRLVGIAALHDTPRPDSARLVGELKGLGVSVKMLTGDALPIAREVAQQIGLGNSIDTVAALRDNAGTEEGLHVAEESDGFAEVYPEDKHLAVRALQQRGHVVGMTGDGVNDAPALKQAEVGIATSNAADVAKKAASVVLTTEGLEGIVELVKAGRRIYQRIVTWILNKIVKTFLIVVFVVLGFIVTGEYVVSIFSMVLLLFLTDFVTLSVSTDNVRHSPTPDKWKITGLVKVALSLGALVVAESMLLLYVAFYRLGYRSNTGQLYTLVFDYLAFSTLFNMLILRERGRFWSSAPSRLLAFSVAADIAAVSLISVFGVHELAPVSPLATLAVLAYAFVTCVLVNDLFKVALIGRLLRRPLPDSRRSPGVV